MTEPVRQTKHPWIAGIAVAGLAATYFFLMGTSQYPEPGPNFKLDVGSIAEVDNVETRFEERDRIVPDLKNPRAMAIGPRGLYVAGQDAVVVIGQEDTEIARFEISGTPNCMALAEDGVIYLGMAKHVVTLNSDGTPRATWDSIGPRSYITSMAVSGEDVYVADAGSRVILRFDREGVLKERIGELDAARDVPGIEVPSPYLDLAINDEGNLWVVNPGRLGLERYRSNGDIVTSWYKPSFKLEGFTGCCNPTQIAFTGSGKLITCEKGLVRVKIYDVTSGEFQELVAGSKLFPRQQSVRDLAVDARDRILVLDPRSDSIRVFAVKETENDSTGQPV